MRNKKVLGLLLAGVMITAIPFNVFADEKDEVKTENPAAVETVENKDEVKVEETETEEVKEETTEEVVEEEKLEVSEEKVPEAVTEEPEETEFTVKFDSDGETAVPEQTVKEGENATEPNPAPTKDGFKLLGWYDGTTKVTFPYEVTKDVTLKASWEKVVPVTKVLSISERYYDNGRFYGKVTSDGSAVEGATVKLYDYDGDYLGQADKTDENGYFDIYLGDYYGYYYDDYYDGYYHYDSLRDKYFYFDSYGDRQYIN